MAQKIPEPFFSLKIKISEKRKCANKWFSIYFCFSDFDFERKKVCGFFGLVEYQKSYKFSKNIEKTPNRRVAKKLQFCTGRRKSHFFFTHPVEKNIKQSTWKRRKKQMIWKETPTYASGLGDKKSKNKQGIYGHRTSLMRFFVKKNLLYYKFS